MHHNFFYVLKNNSINKLKYDVQSVIVLHDIKQKYYLNRIFSSFFYIYFYK